MYTNASYLLLHPLLLCVLTSFCASLLAALCTSSFACVLPSFVDTCSTLGPFPLHLPLSLPSARALLPSCPSALLPFCQNISQVLALPNGRPLWRSALGTLHKCPWSHWSPAAARHRWCSALGHPASLTFSALRRSASPALSAVIVAMLVCLRACLCLCACLRL